MLVTVIFSTRGYDDNMPTPLIPSDVLCARLKKVGYSRSKTVKLYGEVLELESDPYLEGEHFVVEARAPHASKIKVVRIPRFIVHSARAA